MPDNNPTLMSGIIFFSKSLSVAAICGRQVQPGLRAPLAFATVIIQQFLKTRIVSQWVPNRIYFETLYRDPTRSVQQSLQNFDRVSVVAKDCMNLGHRSRNFLSAKGVFALRE